MTREASRIRNDLTVGPVSTAWVVVNYFFAQFALSLACTMKKLQPRYKVISGTLKRFFEKRNQDTRNEKRTTLTKLERKVAIEKSKHIIDDL